jgi:hypothetical protein
MAQRRRRRCREGGTPTATSSVAGPEAGLVGLHDGSRHETRADVPRLAREGVTGGVQHVDDGAFADFEAEDVGRKPRQACVKHR